MSANVPLPYLDCNLCGLMFNGIGDAINHYEGKNHAKVLRKVQNGTYLSNQQAFDDIGHQQAETKDKWSCHGDKNDSTEELNVMKVNILPSKTGYYGFDIKGGADQNMPIFVSHIEENTPADRYVCVQLILSGRSADWRDVSTKSDRTPDANWAQIFEASLGHPKYSYKSKVTSIFQMLASA